MNTLSSSGSLVGAEEAQYLTSESTQIPCCCRKAYVASDGTMDFLKDTVASAPDMAAEEEGEEPKVKRRRCYICN